MKIVYQEDKMVLEKLIGLLCEQLDIEPDEVNENTDIINDTSLINAK